MLLKTAFSAHFICKDIKPNKDLEDTSPNLKGKSCSDLVETEQGREAL